MHSPMKPNRLPKFKSMPRLVVWLLLCIGLPLWAASPSVVFQFPNTDYPWALGIPIPFSVAGPEEELTYTWTLSNGETLSGPSPSYTPTEHGPLQVTLTATNSAGETSQPDTRFIYVYATERFINAPVIEGINLSANAVIDGQTIFAEASFSDPDSEPPYQFRWFWTENGVTKRSDQEVLELTPNLNSATTETINLSLVILDESDNPSIAPSFSAFQVLPAGSNLPPQATILEPASSIIKVVQGNEVTFRAEAQDPENDLPITLTWLLPDGSMSTDNPTVYQFDTLGFFAVRLVATDSRGNQDPARNVISIEVVAEDDNDALTSGTIFQPLQATRLATGESIILSGVPSGVDPNRAGRWRISNAVSGQVIGELEGNRPGRFRFDQAGFYEVFYYFDEFGRESPKNNGNIRWVSVHDRDTNRAPRLTHAGDFLVLAKNGEPVALEVEVEDESPNDLTFYWIVDSILQPNSNNTRFDATFNLAATDFDRGISVRKVEVIGIDASGKPADQPTVFSIYVYPDRTPPLLNVNQLGTGNTVYVPVGGSYDLIPQIENPAEWPLSYSWRAYYTDALTDSIMESSQEVPPAPTFNRPGLAIIEFNAESTDGQQRAAYGFIVWVQVYDPSAPPVTTITKPLSDQLTIEAGHALTFEGFVTDPNFLSGNRVTSFNRIRNQMRWIVTRDGQPHGEYSQNEPRVLTFAEEGRYQVSLQTTNSIGLSAAQPDQIQIDVVAERGDDGFEPNNTRDQAADIDLGHYGAVSLGPEDSEDWYRFNLPTERASLELEFDLRTSPDPLKVEVYQGETLVHQDSLSAGQKHPFSFHGGQAGDYLLYLALDQTTAAKRMLSFGLTITVSQPRLTFPYPKTDEVDQTTLSLVNAAGGAAQVTLIARSHAGQTLSEQVYEIAARGVLENTVDSLFPDTQTLDIGWVQVLSDQKIEGLASTVARDNETAVAEAGIVGTLERLVLPHIAQDTGQWFTQAAVVNSSGETLDTLFRAKAGDFSVGGIAGTHQSRLLDFETFFGGSLPSTGSEWGRFEESTQNPGLSGIELFGTKTGSPRICALNLSSDRAKNPNFVFQGKDIYFPHVAEDTQTFWTGIAFVNDGDTATQVLLTAYNRAGDILSQQAMTMEPKGKQVGLAPTFFPDLAAGTKISWIRLQTEGIVHGYALFGDNDGDNTQLAGFPAATGGARELCFPKVAFVPGETYTGLAVVNLSEQNSAALTYEAYAADGTLLGQVARNVGPRQKDVALVESLFGGTLPAGTSWVRLTSSEPLAGFQLMGRLDGKYLAATLAQ